MEGRYPFKYDAFISYRHCEPDKSVAEKLHRMLEGFRIPKSIAKACGRKQIKRVFRDRDELPTSSNLADNITEALKDSEFLIVVCSPRTPQSQWVLKEIEDFKAIHGHNKVLALLIEGDPKESFPEQLCYVKSKDMYADGSGTDEIMQVEPLAADIRASSEKEMLKKLRTEILRLISPMLNCGYDDLRQRHRERRIKAVLTASISVSAFFIAFGAVSMYQSMVISRQNQEISKKNDEIVAQIQKTQISQSRYLADISSRLLKEGDRYRAVLVAREALPKDLADPDRPYVEEAEFALARALGVYEIDTLYDMDLVLDHNKSVSYIELSPDGKTLLTLSTDGYSRMWNMEDGKCAGEYYTNHSSISSGDSIAFIDSSTIASANYDNITCFDIKGNLMWQREFPTTQICVSGNRLAALSTGRLKVLDASTGDTIVDIDLQNHMDLKDFNNYISSIKLSADGGKVGIGTSFGKAFVFSAETGGMLDSYSTGLQYVSDLAFSPEGYIAAASNELIIDDLLGGGNGMLNVYSPHGKEPDISIAFTHSVVDNVQFSSFNTNLVILTEGEKLNICDISSGEIVYSFISGDNITDYEVYDDFIITSSNDGTIRFCFMKNSGYESDWHRITRPEPITGMEIGNGSIAISCQLSKKVYIMNVLFNDNTIKLTDHNNTIVNTDFSPDGSMSVSSGTDGELVLCSLSDKKAVKSISLGSRILDCRFVKNDRIIAVPADGGVMLLDNDLQTIKKETTDSISWVSFNPDETVFAIGCGRQITVFSSEDLKTIASVAAGYSVSCSFSSDNKLMLANRSGEAKLVDLNTGLETLLSDDAGIVTGAVSGDGMKYALACEDKTIKLYATGDSKKEPVIMKGSVNEAVSLFFSPDSKVLFAGYDDNGIEVFSCLDGTLLTAFGSDFFGGALKKVIFSSDGSRIACIDEGNAAAIIDSSSYKILAQASIADIDENFEKILSNWSEELFQLPVYTPQMLLDEANKQLNGRMLTDREKVEMFIE